MVDSMRFGYIIRKKIDGILRAHFRREDGSAVSLAALYEDGAGGNPLDSVREGIEALPGVVEGEVRALQARLNDNMRAWQKSAGCLWGVLLDLVAFAAAYDDSPDWTWQQGRLFDSPAFATYIGPDWPSIHGYCRGALVSDYQHQEALAADARQALRQIFDRLGITILDQPRGVSVLDFRLVTPPVESASEADATSGAEPVVQELTTE
jgi:hypothetical protein